MTLRTVDVWDLAPPIGIRSTRELPSIEGNPDHRVMVSRNTDERPRRRWTWQRDNVTEIELARILELRDVTAQAAPIDYWVRNRNALVWTGEIARGVRSRSPHYGWSPDTPAELDASSTGAALPAGGTGAAAFIGSIGTPTAPATIRQLVGRALRNEVRAYTFSTWISPDDSLQTSIGVRCAGVSSGARFNWSAGELVVASADTGVTASVQGSSGAWRRAVVTVSGSVVKPSDPLEVFIAANNLALAAGGDLYWGAQLVLDDEPRSYQPVSGDRKSPAPVTIASVKHERTSPSQYRVSVELEEWID